MSNQTGPENPFIVDRVPVGPRIWRIARLSTKKVMVFLKTAELIARKKIEHTRDESQSGQLRNATIKYQRQLMGTMAEVAVTSLLNQYLEKQGLASLWEAIRYDSVRTDDFKSPEGEYDIRLTNRRSNTYYEIESRSSIARNRPLDDALRKFDIIGPYASAIKSNESVKDFYVRPLYAYLDFEKPKYSDVRFRELLTTGRVQLCIVGGCTGTQMAERGFAKSMNQGATRYRVVRILDGLDLFDFLRRVSERLREDSLV